MEGASLAHAVVRTRTFVAAQPSAAETTRAIDAAVELAESRPEPTPDAVERLGGAWIAEEALSIAIYRALVARSFEHGLLAAVNHSGDSDSTGSMTGHISQARRSPRRERPGSKDACPGSAPARVFTTDAAGS